MLPPRRRALAAVSVPAEKERARNWEERKQQSNWAQSRPTHGSETSPNRTHNNTQGNHEVRALQQPPNEAHAERAISKHPPLPLPLQGPHVLHKGGGCAPRAGRCPPRGWQQGRDQPTTHGTVHVVRRCETLVRGGRRVGQGRVRDRGTQERQQTGGGATQTHRTREPHQEGQGRAQQTRRRGTARQERQPEQREQGTRMEGMGEHAHGRQRQQRGWPGQPAPSLPGARATPAQPASGGGCLPQPRWAVCATGAGAHQGQTGREGETDIWWTAGTVLGGTGHLGLTHTEPQRGRLWTACGQRRVDSKNSQTTPATTSTSSIRQLLGAAHAQTAHPATSSTAPAHQTTGLRERGNDTSNSTGRSGQQNAATRRNMRRDERVTVQGPVKEQQPDGMSHRGGGGKKNRVPQMGLSFLDLYPNIHFSQEENFFWVWVGGWLGLGGEVPPDHPPHPHPRLTWISTSLVTSKGTPLSPSEE